MAGQSSAAPIPLLHWLLSPPHESYYAASSSHHIRPIPEGDNKKGPHLETCVTGTLLQCHINGNLRPHELLAKGPSEQWPE